jgi:ABC-2 type transport system permease protein
MNIASPQTPRAAFGKLLLNETRLAWRVPLGLVLGLGLPILLLIIFGSIPALRQTSAALGGLSYFSVSYPVLIGMTIVSLSLLVVPRSLVTYRETGFLRRLSVTPVPPAWLLAAQVLVNLVMAVAGLGILTVVGMTAFGLETPKDLLGFLIASTLTITALFGLGLGIAAIAKNNGVANGIGGLLFYVLLFFGGLWVPRQVMPPVLLSISDWTPLGASVAALQNAMQGTFPTLQSLFCLMAYTVVFGYLAVRYFRWE